MDDLIFIEDGLTLKGYIAARPGIHGDLWFTYRPMTVQQNATLADKIAGKSNLDVEILATATVATHVLEWSAKQPINAKSLMSLQSQLWNRLYNIVAGRSASDTPPDDSDSRTIDQKIQDAEEEARGFGQTPCEAERLGN